MNVADILKFGSGTFQTASADTSLWQITKKMQTAGVQAVVIANAGLLLQGLVTADDIIAASAQYGPDIWHCRAAGIMTVKLYVCHLDDNADEVLNVMCAQEICHLPVVSGQEVKGIVSQCDVLRFQFAQMRATLANRFTGPRLAHG